MPDRTTYRFWGRRDPSGREKPPIRAELQATEVEAGVARLRLYDPIDSWGGIWGVSAKEFADTLDELPAGTSELRLHINSPGGEVFEGIAIMNLLRAHPARVVGVVDGLAASAASFIAAAADELVMNPNTELMIHDAWGIAIGPAETMRDVAGRLDALSDNIASVYQRKAGGTVEDWRAAMLAETWYSADESVAAGLADRVDDGDAPDEDAAAAQAAFDLTVFRNAGREQAPGPAAAPLAAEDPGADERRLRHARRRHELAAARHRMPRPA